MIEERHLDTINRAIDGEASVAELALLDAAMQQSPEVRENWETMHELAQVLSSEPLVDPPPSLRPNVMQQLRKRRGKPPLHLATGLGNGKRRRFAIAWAAAAAAVIVTAVVMTVPDRNARLSDRAGGTMASVDSRTWPTVARVSSADQSVSLTVRSNGKLLSVSPSFTSPAPQQALLEWNSSAASLVSVSGASVSPAGPGSITFDPAANDTVVVLRTLGPTNSFVLKRGSAVLLKVSL